MTDKVYQFLAAPRRTRLKILQLEAKKQALESSLSPQGISYDGDRVQTTPEDRMAAVYAEIDALDRRIKELKLSAVDEINAVEAACAKLDEETERTVMIMYYVGGQEMEEIAKKIQYSVQSVYKFRRLGQKNIEKFCS